MFYDDNRGVTLLKMLRKHPEVRRMGIGAIAVLIDMLSKGVIQPSVSLEFMSIRVFRYTDVFVILRRVQQATNTVLTFSTGARATQDDVTINSCAIATAFCEQLQCVMRDITIPKCYESRASTSMRVEMNILSQIRTFAHYISWRLSHTINH